MKKEIEYEESLTNEQLLKRFKSQFELVRYAIQLAQNAIKSQRELDVDTDSQNVAFQVLAEIAINKERFEEIPASRIEEQKMAQDRRSGVSVTNQHKKSTLESSSSRGKEGKKDKKSKAKFSN